MQNFSTKKWCLWVAWLIAVVILTAMIVTKSSDECEDPECEVDHLVEQKGN
jgi:hypothetical protein